MLLTADALFLLLDQPIRPRHHFWWNRQTDLLRGFQIDDEFELRWLLHRQVGGFGSLQDSVHEICDAPVAVRVSAP